MLQIKMTYCQPPQLYWAKDEYGRDVLSRVPKSPTRPARKYEVETWWEAIGEVKKRYANAADWVRASVGAILREV